MVLALIVAVGLLSVQAQAADWWEVEPAADTYTIALYNFEDTTNLGYDSAGNSHLTNNGAVAAAGKWGGGISLDGSSYLRLDPVDTSSINNIPEGFTIECWVKTGIQDQPTAFYIRRDGWYQMAGVWNELLSYFFVWGDDVQQWQTGHPRMPADSQWHHMAGVFDPEKGWYGMYLDGELIGIRFDFNEGDWHTSSKQVGGYANSGWTIPFAIGALETGGAGLTGYMDAVRISNIPRHVLPPILDELASIDAKKPGVELTWPSQIGSKYRPYFVNNMGDSWTAADTEITADETSLAWIDQGDTARLNPGSDTVTKRFYTSYQTATSWDLTQEFETDTHTVALFHLEDGAETVDASDNSLHLTAFNISDTHFVTGEFGDAIDFSDSYTYLIYPNAYGTPFDITGPEFTLEAWVKVEDSNDPCLIIHHDGHYSLGLGWGRNAVTFTMWGNNEMWPVGTDPYSVPADGRFHHIAAIFNGVEQMMYIYVDGIERQLHNNANWTLNTLADTDAASPLAIANDGGGGAFWGCTVDEVRISNYDRRRTDIPEPLPVSINQIQNAVEVSWTSSPFSVYRLYWSPTDIPFSSPDWELCSEITTYMDTQTMFVDTGDPDLGRPAPPLEDPVNRYYKLVEWRAWQP